MKLVNVIVEVRVPDHVDASDAVDFVAANMDNADYEYIEEVAGEELEPVMVIYGGEEQES